MELEENEIAIMEGCIALWFFENTDNRDMFKEWEEKYCQKGGELE